VARAIRQRGIDSDDPRGRGRHSIGVDSGSEPEGQQVFVVTGDKRVEQRLVTVGQTNKARSVITKGLAAGEMVVREGQFLLGPGARVY